MRRDVIVVVLCLLLFLAALGHGMRGWNALPSPGSSVSVGSFEGGL